MSLSSRDVVVYFDGTFMQRSNGAHARVEALLRFLVARVDRVVLYSFRDHPTCPWTDEHIASFAADFPRVRLMLDRRPLALKAFARSKVLLAAVLPGAARLVTRLALPGVAPVYDALVRDYPGACIIVNYADGLCQLNGVRHGSVLLETHDVKFINYNLQHKSASHSIKSLLRLRWELALLDVASGIIAISPVEAHLFRMLIADARVFYVPAFPQTSRPPAPQRDDADAVYDLVFVGSDNVLNVEGLVGFLDAFGPWLRTRRLAVCGKVCSHDAVIRAAARCPTVSLLGFVPDIADVYACAKAAISPVVGTGLKIKIVDALAHGRPVFASCSSFAGLPPGHDGCVFPLRQEVMDEVLDDVARWRATVRRSRAYADDVDAIGDHGAMMAFIAGLEAEGATGRDASGLSGRGRDPEASATNYVFR